MKTDVKESRCMTIMIRLDTLAPKQCTWRLYMLQSWHTRWAWGFLGRERSLGGCDMHSQLFCFNAYCNLHNHNSMTYGEPRPRFPRFSWELWRTDVAACISRSKWRVSATFCHQIPWNHSWDTETPAICKNHVKHVQHIKMSGTDIGFQIGPSQIVICQVMSKKDILFFSLSDTPNFAIHLFCTTVVSDGSFPNLLM